MWNDSTELVVAGSGQVYVAPVGTALPSAHNSAINSAFVGLGYNTEDGVTLGSDKEVKEHMSWQTADPVRADVISWARSLKFALEQWNETNMALAFGGGSVVSDGAGGYRYDFPEVTDGIAEYSTIVDAKDGNTVHRLVIARCYVSDGVESQFKRDELATLPITLKVLTPDTGRSINYYTNSAGFAVGS